MKATIYTDLGRFETPYNANRYSKSVFITTIRKEGTGLGFPRPCSARKQSKLRGRFGSPPKP